VRDSTFVAYIPAMLDDERDNSGDASQPADPSEANTNQSAQGAHAGLWGNLVQSQMEPVDGVPPPSFVEVCEVPTDEDEESDTGEASVDGSLDSLLCVAPGCADGATDMTADVAASYNAGALSHLDQLQELFATMRCEDLFATSHGRKQYPDAVCANSIWVLFATSHRAVQSWQTVVHFSFLTCIR
jgi:hypothetical protein